MPAAPRRPTNTASCPPHAHPEPGYAGRLPAPPDPIGTGTRDAVVRLLAAAEAGCASCRDRQLTGLHDAQRSAPPRRSPLGQRLDRPGPAEAVYAYVLWATATLMTGQARAAGLAPATYLDAVAAAAGTPPEAALAAQLCWLPLGALTRDHPADDTARLHATLTLTRAVFTTTDLNDPDSAAGLLDLIDLAAKICGSTAHAAAATSSSPDRGGPRPGWAGTR